VLSFMDSSWWLTPKGLLLAHDDPCHFAKTTCLKISFLSNLVFYYLKINPFWLQ
jgi:hypothetical protein